jgi:hypothetical protein
MVSFGGASPGGSAASTLPQIGTLLAGGRLDSGEQLRGFLASLHGRPVLFCIWYLELAFIPQLT